MATYPIFHGITLADNAVIENLIIERLALDPLGPDEGRVWYNSAAKVFKMSVTDENGGQKTLTFQDAESFAAFLAELASTAADASGAKKVGYDGHVGANGKFSIQGAALDVVLDAIVGGIDAEKQATADLASTEAGKGVNAIGYDGATGPNGKFSVAPSTLKAALDAMVAKIDANAQASSISSDTIQLELDATQTGAGLGENGAYAPDEATSYLKAADFLAASKTASLKEADALLDAKAKSISDELAAYKASNDSAVDARVKKAGDVMTGPLNMGNNVVTSTALPTQDDHLTNKAYVDSVATGLDVKKSVRVAALSPVDLTTGGLLVVDDVQIVAGDRVLVMGQADAAENGIYVAAEGSWARAADANSDAEVTPGMFTFVEQGTVSGNNGYVLVTDGAVVLGTTELDFEQFSGAGQVIAGAGISKNGNEIFLNFGAGIVETPSDEIGIDFTDGLFTTEDGTTPSSSAAAKLGIKLDGASLTKGPNGLKLSDSVMAGTDALQSELDATQVGAGLGLAGTYTAKADANYIAAATSLFDADVVLDAQLKATADALAAEVTARTTQSAALQAELDATQTGAGLQADGSYVAKVDANYVRIALNLFDADQLLDTQLKATSDNLATEIAERAAQDGKIRTGAGLTVDGALPPVAGTTYMQAATSLFTGLTALDSALSTGLTGVKGNLSNVIGQINANKHTYVSGAPALVHSIQHNLNAGVVDAMVWIQREDGRFYNDLALVTEVSNNELTVTLTAAANIKVSVEAIKDLTDPNA